MRVGDARILEIGHRTTSWSPNFAGLRPGGTARKAFDQCVGPIAVPAVNGTLRQSLTWPVFKTS